MIYRPSADDMQKAVAVWLPLFDDKVGRSRNQGATKYSGIYARASRSRNCPKRGARTERKLCKSRRKAAEAPMAYFSYVEVVRTSATKKAPRLGRGAVVQFYPVRDYSASFIERFSLPFSSAPRNFTRTWSPMATTSSTFSVRVAASLEM